jgi:proteasome assembly chaperone (PAC2) family protein
VESGEHLIFNDMPVLRKPIMICGFNGWLDGGQAASGSVKQLIRQLHAKKFAEIPSQYFHIYQVQGCQSLRPEVRIENGLLTEFHAPQSQFFYAINQNSEHDIILLLGTEPNLNWEAYSDSIIRVAREFSTERIYLLGGVLDKIPYTFEPKVFCSFNRPGIRDEMKQNDVSFVSRVGPATFCANVLYASRQSGIDAVSLTVQAVCYPEFNIFVHYNPKSIIALLLRIAYLTSLEINYSWLNDRTMDFEQKLDSLRSQCEKLSVYLEVLENCYGEETLKEPLDMSGDEAVKIVEDMLRTNHPENH